MIAVICPYCNGTAKLVDSTTIYRGVDYGCKFWACLPCQAWVGVHKKKARGKKYVPLGTLANRNLRHLRMQCHNIFDPIWRDGTIERQQAYHYMAEIMGIMKEDAHIGMFNEEQCQQLINKLEPALRKLRGALNQI